MSRAVTVGPKQAAAIAAIAAIALLCAWTIWQPLRSADADAAALTALSANHPAAALADVKSAAGSDPVATDPLLYEWEIYSDLGDAAAARGALQADVALQPANYETWLQLGQYDLTLDQPREAIAALTAALHLFPQDPITGKLIAQAQSDL